MQKTDYLIIGGGIIGITVARELQRRDPKAHVTVIDKEASLGQHASGRNSGVLHSGIYYPSDSLKAQFTREGNLAWRIYCEEKGISIDPCGKLIVARDEKEHAQLETLEQRGFDNGVEVHRVDKTQAQEIECRARTFEHALFVPSTATADPLDLLNAQQKDFTTAGGHMLCGYPYLGNLGNNAIRAGPEHIQAGMLVNCAGLYADKVAKDFGFGKQYTLLPFKGLYHYAAEDSVPPRSHIYPVPDLKNPFLGVHFTRTLGGRTKIGPTAIAALWREHYGGFAGFKFLELMEVASRELSMLATNRNNFRSLAGQEIRKYQVKNMIAEAETLMNDVSEMRFKTPGKPGIRAQLVKKENNELVMDFAVEGDDRSIHVLNAISPAWTCAIPFSKFVVDKCLSENSLRC